MSIADRTTACLPLDVARLFDATVEQANFTNQTFIGSEDDDDALFGMIEDAENEFRQLAPETYRIGRQGIEGQRETFETVTYKLSGHKQYRRTFSHATYDYSFREGTVRLEKERILPFDSAEGDAVYVFAGLDATDPWEDITDEEGDTWQIVDYNSGRLALDPNELRRRHDWFGGNDGIGLGSGRQRNIRLNVSYRYGSLGGSRSGSTTTELTDSLTDTDTTTVGVADGARMPSGGGSGPVVLRIGTEYLLADPDPAGDQIDVLERGIRGTEATSHDSGARVNYTPPSIRKAIAARAAMQVVNSGRYRSWAPDSEDDIDAGQVYDNLEAIWSGTIEAMS